MLVAGVACIAGGALTVSVAVRLVLPWPLVVLVKVMVAGPDVPGARLFALAFTVKVTVVAEVVAVPEVADALSQLGTPEIEKLAEPVVVLNWYGNDDGENGPP